MKGSFSAASFTHGLDDVNDWCLLGVLGVVRPGLLTDQRPDLVHVDGRLEVLVSRQMEVPHADLPKVARMAVGGKETECEARHKLKDLGTACHTTPKDLFLRFG